MNPPHKFVPSKSDLNIMRDMVQDGKTNLSIANHFNVSTKTLAPFVRSFKDEIRTKEDKLFSNGYICCSLCSEIKKISEFYKNAKNKYGYSYKCRACAKSTALSNYDAKHRQPEKYKMTPAEKLEHNRKYFREYQKKRAATDINYKLSKRIRYRIWSALNGKKDQSSIEYLGCTIEEFKLHLESLWEDWMNWENYGNFSYSTRMWQIDHITPLNTFDLTNYDEACAAFHYTNCRPLCAQHNLQRPNDGGDIN